MQTSLIRPIRLLTVLLCAAGLPLASLSAQADSSATLRGSVRIESGLPVEDALISLERDGEPCDNTAVRSLPNGSFTITKLVPGQYTLRVRRLGYEALAKPIEVRDGATRYDAVITPRPALLTFAQLEDGWTGVVGLVGDGADMEGLEGVQITVMGNDATATTDAAGRFVLPLKDLGTGALRVEREGFEPKLVSYSIDKNSLGSAVVVLDSGTVTKEWASVWTDLNQRAKWSTPRTVRVSRGELAATGAANLLQALEGAPSVKNSGVIMSRLACVFVDGLPRPGYPVDAIRTNAVEYVEAYPARTDLSRTLANRWPPNAPCGAPGSDAVARRAIDSGTGAYYIVVWTR